MESNQKAISQRRSTLMKTNSLRYSNKECNPIEIKASKVLNPTQVETDIQISRIMRVMDECYEKLKFVAWFPYFLYNEGEIFKKYLNEEQAEVILEVCNRFSEGKKRRHVKETSPEKETKIYSRLAEVIEIAFENHSLKLKVKQCKLKLPRKTISFLNYFKALQKITKEKLLMDAAKEFEKNFNLKQAWQLNKEAMNKIADIEQQISNQQEQLGGTVREKETLIQKLQDDIQQTKDNFKDKNSEKTMGKESTMSEYKQKSLKEHAEAVELQYQNLLASNLHNEKLLRAKKTKAEAQLMSWLAKYDADIGERQAEYDEIKSGYDEEQRLLKELQAKMNELDLEYIPMREQKAIEEEEEWERRVFEFLKCRSARRIQKWWRGILWRKAERRRIARAKWLAKKEKMKIKIKK